MRKSSGRTIRFALASNGRAMQAGGLRRQLGASLTTAGAQDGAAGAGAHPQTETVDLGAPAVVRLEGSLAHGDISKTQGSGGPRRSGRNGVRPMRPSTD